MLYIVLVFKWSCLDTRIWIFNLCSCHKLSNRTPTFYQRLLHTENTTESGSSMSSDMPSIRFLRYRISLTTLKRWWNEPKTLSCTIMDKSASSGTSILVTFNSEMGKENKLACRNVEIYLSKTKKRNKMGWKWSLAFNNDDENYLQYLQKTV